MQSIQIKKSQLSDSEEKMKGNLWSYYKNSTGILLPTWQMQVQQETAEDRMAGLHGEFQNILYMYFFWCNQRRKVTNPLYGLA